MAADGIGLGFCGMRDSLESMDEGTEVPRVKDIGSSVCDVGAGFPMAIGATEVDEFFCSFRAGEADLSEVSAWLSMEMSGRCRLICGLLRVDFPPSSPVSHPVAVDAFLPVVGGAGVALVFMRDINTGVNWPLAVDPVVVGDNTLTLGVRREDLDETEGDLSLVFKGVNASVLLATVVVAEALEEEAL